MVLTQPTDGTVYDPARDDELVADPDGRAIFDESWARPPRAVCRCGEVLKATTVVERDEGRDEDADDPDDDSDEQNAAQLWRDELGRDVAILQARDDRFADQRKADAVLKRREWLRAHGMTGLEPRQQRDKPARSKARRAAEFQRYKQTPLYRLRHPGTAAAMNTRNLTSKQEAALYTGLRKLPPKT